VGKKLIVVESPAKAKTIQNFLGEEFQVIATKGHIRDLPEKRFGIKIENGHFYPQYQITKNHREIVKQLREAAKGAEKIYIATDEDREGEAIGFHILEVLGKRPEEVDRIVFHEITPKAIERALANPRKLDLNRVDAQQARRLLDRIVGYKLSPLLAKKIKKGLSAGRVQSATLKLVVDREREIQQFKPRPYYTIEGKFKGVEGKLVKWGGKELEKFSIGSEEEARAIVERLKGLSYRVGREERREQVVKAPPPFMTSTLQQTASTELRFSPRRTMELAQRLYEGVPTPIGEVGVITYMRTDSLHIAPEAREEAAQFIRERFGEEYLEPKEFKVKGKRAQEAHEAIRPTHIELTPEELKGYLGEEEWKLYDLIFRRFIASQMKGARFASHSIYIDSDREGAQFKLHGRKLLFDGFYKIYGKPAEELELPPFQVGESVPIEEVKYTQHFTKPPDRYTEAGLIKKMEELGIGRPSTYAPTITLLKRRGYINLKKRAIHPTEEAFKVIGLLEEHFPEIVDSKFTANMEEMLDQIATGREDWQEVLRDFYFPFEEQLKRKEKEIPSQKVEIPTGERCPECGGELIIRDGKYGKFIGCSNFPACRYRRSLHRKEVKKLEGVKCPKCGGELVVRHSKKGEFLGCSNYPKCRFIAPFSVVEESCDSCGGELVTREGEVKCLRCEPEVLKELIKGEGSGTTPPKETFKKGGE
jgi:DNA topoisomerase-1